MRSVCMGVWVEVGSRDESPQTRGIFHFIEHMLFKGTKHRSARQIAESLESVGGGLNGFTSREKTCYLARILDEHLPLAVDVLCDLVQNPRFDPQQLEREKLVVEDEIRDLEDSPADYIDERITTCVWRRNALGFPIMGSPETVARFTSEMLRAQLASCYTSENIVVSAAGNLDHQELVKEVEKAFSFPTGSSNVSRRNSVFDSTGQLEVLPREIKQLHLCLGGLAYPYAHPGKYALLILNTVLGDGMSSRLFQNVREKRGLAYAVYSSLDLASDTGFFQIYLATDPGKSRQAFAAVIQELDLIRERGLRKEELNHAKAQLKGRLMLGLESMGARMTRLAQQEILLGASMSLDETQERIDAVSAEQVQKVAQELFRRRRLSMVAIGPIQKDLFRAEDLYNCSC
ncbi:insulinase family protein [bacterium]|nr:insulinase family protein [bacterium]